MTGHAGFINPDGEALLNAELPKMIEILRSYEVYIKLISNGYLFNDFDYFSMLKECDEVIGELAVVTEKDFVELQRPMEDYTLQQYITNMTEFSKQYHGKFVLAVNILKNYTDLYEAVELLGKYIYKINPDLIYLETPRSKKLKGAFSVNKEKLKLIRKQLKNIIGCKSITIV